MVSVKDVPPQEFVKEYAAHLKRAGKLPVPEWVDVVKTSVAKEMAPYDKDWYYIRAAAIARKVYLNNGLGVGKLSKIYGGKKRRGVRASKFQAGSTSVARAVLQSLETIKVIDKKEDGGRVITVDGQRDLDRIAGQVLSKLQKN